MLNLNFRKAASILLHRAIPFAIVGSLVVVIPIGFTLSARRDIAHDIEQVVPGFRNRLMAIDAKTASSTLPVEIFHGVGDRGYTVLATAQRALPEDVPAGAMTKGPCAEVKLRISVDSKHNDNPMSFFVIANISNRFDRIPIYMCPTGPQGRYTQQPLTIRNG